LDLAPSLKALRLFLMSEFQTWPWNLEGNSTGKEAAAQLWAAHLLGLKKCVFGVYPVHSSFLVPNSVCPKQTLKTQLMN
jgi:hypothetical protein